MRWIFLLLPWIELFTLIQLGSQIGALATLLYVFVTLVLGCPSCACRAWRSCAPARGRTVGWSCGQLLADELAVGSPGSC
jgi:UPF0716 protein FxsA